MKKRKQKRKKKKKTKKKKEKKGGYLNGGRRTNVDSLSITLLRERRLESRGTRIRQIEVYPSCESSQVGGGEGFLEEMERRCKSE